LTGLSEVAANSEYAALRANALAMAGLQVANLVLPLLLVPYLARTLGIDVYGGVAFGLGVCQLAAVVTDYGFGLSATYYVARRRNRPSACARLLSAVSACKAALALLVALLIVTYVAVSSQEDKTRAFLLMMILPIVAQAALPSWFFVGIERMGWLATTTALTRLLHVLLVYLFVDGPGDYWLIAISLGVANAVCAAVSVFVLRKLGYRFVAPRLRVACAVWRSASSFFISRASVAAYTSLGVVVLGLAGLPAQVAIYSAAEQLYKAAQSTVGMVSQAIYPYLVRTKDYCLARRIFNATILVSMAGSAGMHFVGQYIVVAIFGESFLPAAKILDVFCITFLVAAPSVLLGYPVLGALGRLDIANRSVIVAGVIQLVGLSVLFAFSKVGAVQVAMCVLIAEFSVLCIRGRWVRKLVNRSEVTVEAA
jgi:polysaccharide transporter, PST family